MCYFDPMCLTAVCLTAMCLTAVCLTAVCLTAVCLTAVCLTAVCYCYTQSMSTCVILNQCCVYYGNVSVFRVCLLPQESSVLAIQANEILTAIVQGMRKEEPRSLLY